MKFFADRSVRTLFALVFAALALFTVLTLWMVVSGTFGFKGSKRGMALTMLCINLPALVVLVLLGVQELSLHAYWDNAVGFSPAMWRRASILMRRGSCTDFFTRSTPWQRSLVRTLKMRRTPALFSRIRSPIFPTS